VQILDSTHIDVTFSEAIEKASAENIQNYEIDQGVNVFVAILDMNQKTVHLSTTTHQPNILYTLTVNHIKDLAPTPNEIAPDSEIQYNYTYQDRESPQVADVQVIYATYLKVLFNETVEQASAENISNYSINNGIQVFGSILDNDLKTVHLTTSEHQPNAIYKITIDSVMDRSPNRNIIDKNTEFEYSYEVSPGTIIIGLNRAQYELAYLNVGDEYYIDRNYTLSNIPMEMNGYLWIKTANDDRDKKDENFLNFQLIEKAKIYIAYDSRALNYPNWLVNDFYRIGKSIGVSEYAENLDLWEKECDPGVVSLGANLAEGAQGVESMYVVIIETNNSQRPGMPDDMGDPFSLGPANMFLLYQNYPNPFNSGTEIRFQLPKTAYVELTIYDVLGQTVRILTSGYKPSGHHILSWNGINNEGLAVPSGVYFSRLIIKKIEETEGQNTVRTIHNYVRKMIMMK